MSRRYAISSHSLGRAWIHHLSSKLDAARRHGLDIELFYEDVEEIAKAQIGNTDPASLIMAAQTVRAMCDERDLNIVCLQPFMHYEGLIDRAKHARRVKEMAIWIQLANILGTDLIGLPSSFLPETETSGDIDLIVQDMRDIADLGKSNGIRLSYEALCWGTHINTWEQAWEVVQAVDRENFGLCLDTFNLAGRVFADPMTASGKSNIAQDDMNDTLRRLRQIDVNKIFCLQVVDAEKLEKPLTSHHPLYNDEQPARMTWSRNCRLFYGETDLGAYLPIKEILYTILIDLYYTGPISAEVFHACLTQPDPNLPNILAQRAARSWRKMEEDIKQKSKYVAEQRPRILEMSHL